LEELFVAGCFLLERVIEPSIEQQEDRSSYIEELSYDRISYVVW
jgi:hypothetical protein